jgi:hypothetical protein
MIKFEKKQNDGTIFAQSFVPAGVENARSKT